MLINSQESPQTSVVTERMKPGSMTECEEVGRDLGRRVATPLEEASMAGAW